MQLVLFASVRDRAQEQLDPFSRFDTIPACDRQTDRRTDLCDDSADYQLDVR